MGNRCIFFPQIRAEAVGLCKVDREDDEKKVTAMAMIKQNQAAVQWPASATDGGVSQNTGVSWDKAKHLAIKCKFNLWATVSLT